MVVHAVQVGVGAVGKVCALDVVVAEGQSLWRQFPVSTLQCGGFFSLVVWETGIGHDSPALHGHLFRDSFLPPPPQQPAPMMG